MDPVQKPDMSNYAKYANDILKMSVGLMDMDPRYDANQDGVVNTQDSTRIQQMFQEGTPFSLDQNPVDQGIGTDLGTLGPETAASSVSELPSNPNIRQLGVDQSNSITDPAERERLLESLIGDKDFQQKRKDMLEGRFQTQQESRQKAQDLALQQMEKPEPTADFSTLRGFFGEEKFRSDPVTNAMGYGTIDPSQITLGGGRDWSQRDMGQMGPLPKGYYTGPADRIYKYGEGPYAESTQKFLDEQGMTFDQFSSSTQDPTDPVAYMDPTQIDPIVTPDTGQAGGSPSAIATPAFLGTEVVPANPTAPPTTSAPATETPGIPNLSDGIGAQLKQLFQQYMGGGQRNRNNYSNPMQQYRTAVTDTDEYKAYNDYASGLGPTEEQRAELQRLQSAFEGTDAYGQFTQQRQQRQNYMQPLGYGGGYGGGYGSGYGGGFQGGFGGYGGGYGGYQQPSYQQPYYRPPMQQQPYYGGGIMGGSSYGNQNNYSGYQQPYQQPYQMAQQYQSYGGNQQPYGMAQQYQQQPAQQPYGSVQPQYPAQFSSYASPFANSIR